MRISDWSADVGSSDLRGRTPQAAHDDTRRHARVLDQRQIFLGDMLERRVDLFLAVGQREPGLHARDRRSGRALGRRGALRMDDAAARGHQRSEEHTSELQSLMRISYAVFCLKKKT